MYLLDTNIWLELLLDQERADEVHTFLEAIPVSRILITDFTLHSIGVVCNRYKRPQVFKDFLQDIVANGQISLSVIPIDELSTVVDATIELGLDFDDAYQYICISAPSAMTPRSSPSTRILIQPRAADKCRQKHWRC